MINRKKLSNQNKMAFSDDPQVFLIYITVIEGRHFAILNMDSVVHVRIGNQRKATAVRKSTDSPYYNEYFVFEFNMPLQSFIDQHVTFTVIQPRKMWRRRKIIGSFKLDIATVWAASDHMFYHKWAIISGEMNENNPEPKGYLKIDIGIVTKGKKPGFPITSDGNDDEIEGNLLLPDNITFERVRANFIFNIYYAEEIPKIKNLSSMKSIMIEFDPLPNTYVEVSFAGLTGKTSVKKNSQAPVWNESIVFTELFPSLCQRFKIELKFTQNVPSLVHYIYLKSISNDGYNGFFPTFGPSFIYFYTSNAVDANYGGKLLLEIKTKILTDLMWSSNNVEVSPINHIPNLQLWTISPVLLYCNIYSTTMLDKKYKDKSISFEITMGGPIAEDTSIPIENISPPIKSIADNLKIYSFLPLDTVYCLSIVLNCIDATRRIYNRNMIRRMYHFLKRELDRVEELFEMNYKRHRTEIDSIYYNINKTLSSYFEMYLQIIPYSSATNIELDENLITLCITEIEDLENKLLEILQHHSRKKVYRLLLNVLNRIDSLSNDMQSCWPDVFLWMYSDNKKVGYYRFPVSDIIFSVNELEKGEMCGILQNIFIKPLNVTKIRPTFGKNSVKLCKLTVQLWIGFQINSDYGLEAVSKCLIGNIVNNFPITYFYSESYRFRCQVYIYQGRFQPGADETGLSDPFCQIVFNEHVLKTKMVPKTIHPIWNETVVFNNIKVHGSIDFISTNTPIITLEVFDLDTCGIEFVGRGQYVPTLTQYDDENIRLKWIKVYNGDEVSGEVLMSADLVMLSEDESSESPNYSVLDYIPDFIKPSINNFRMDVYFWGVHNFKKLHLKSIVRPRITIECGGSSINSNHVQSTKYLNFSRPYQSVNISLPEEEHFYPPLSIKMFDCRGFGWYIFVGTYLAKVQDFIFKPYISGDRQKILLEGCMSQTVTTDSSTDSIDSKTIQTNTTTSTSPKKQKKKFCKLFNKMKDKLHYDKSIEVAEEPTPSIDLDIMDWWTKFYLSTDNLTSEELTPFERKLKIKVYPCELENLEEFRHFNDLIKSFKIYRGKRTGDDVLDEENIIAIFKGDIRIYQWPREDADDFVTETGQPLEEGSFQHYPVNEPVSFIVRVYVIRAIKLRPKDASGKSDPYIIIELGEKKICDRENYIPNEINPVFGRYFELKGILPIDNILTISVWDMDLTTADDLIGDTKIDLENRLYSNHRANCGLSEIYLTKGPCVWRDQYKPSQILEIMCRRNKLQDPVFDNNQVKVGPCVFEPTFDLEFTTGKKEDYIQEMLSLYALHHWKDIPIVGCNLVPEHVETRSLYHYSKPGLEQGKLQLWIDIFPSGDYPPPPPVNIKPRKPLLYELRVIIWNTEDVIMDEDDFFIGEKKSDIYVKGWLTDPEDSQRTDVHYNSINGEGNFNWRFIFPFEYLVAEDKIVVKKKKSVFSVDVTEHKLPCFLNLQVWDNDVFNPDDFLGTLKLSLSRLPRGAKNSKLCTLNILQAKAPIVNLFKTKRSRGWWPFRGKEKGSGDILAGKVEVEFELLPEEEYKNCPAGLGRSDPQGLSPPKRPDISFSWFRNPLKALKFIICRRFRWQIIICLSVVIVVLMFLIGLYSFPNYLVKRILGA